MLDNLKLKVDKTKKFVNNHKTALACTATAVVAWKLSNVTTLKVVLDETTTMAYEWGWRNGVLEETLLTHVEFVDYKKLNEEFAEFTLKMNP